MFFGPKQSFLFLKEMAVEIVFETEHGSKITWELPPDLERHLLRRGRNPEVVRAAYQQMWGPTVSVVFEFFWALSFVGGKEIVPALQALQMSISTASEELAFRVRRKYT